MTKSAKATLVMVALVLAAVNVWYLTRDTSRVRVHRGETMGATFSVTWVESELGPDVPREVDELLRHLTQLTSTYDAKSQVSEFNRSQSTEWFAVAPEVAEVVSIARRVSELSDGVFDITVKPLVAAWGFGPDAQRDPPTEEALNAAASLVGFRRLEVQLEPPALRKRVAGLQVDLNGIVPGYAVDRLASLLARHGISNYLIEVGGELRAAGRKLDMDWQVAIESPDSKDQLADSVYPLRNTALATSGDYRNYYERDGKRLSHTIDPRTRRPIEHALASVTVLAPTCAEADALTKVVSVLGPDAGRDFAEKHGLATSMLVRISPGVFERRQTGWFVGK
jgi:thiamine biosynthesis lipoprotein